ncbi:MAG: cytochrome c biogenesis protein CcsA [Crocinitomicaceae bacterium]|nr:cytochrome c biogenesis protein CcsA [Crocinitomicaceae bacterium]
MDEIVYMNEHTGPGLWGNFFVVLSFCAAFFSAISYYFSTRPTPEKNLWTRIGRTSFYVHCVAVVGTILTLLYILFNHLYEYKYAFDHLNNAMPMKYIFSCMWEGQEGSFLLWTFWNAVLGFFLVRWSRDWEPWVMAIVALVQVFLASMLLGVYFGEFQFGSNPFLLLREIPANIGLPWTQNPQYLSLDAFKDGKGLNALLQNYWMTLHPPTLFLGFASTLFPFAYAIAGMWRGDLKGWMRPAIPWAFFGVMILGTGILMGGAWAYEALGFGGFWAWDPVENASLVPWLTFVGAAHLLVINQGKGNSVFAALILTLSTFILVLYSTFLTRSGVLGDSSVHSFVDSGILAQLLVYLLFFVFLSTVFLTNDKKWRWVYSGLCAILLLFGIGNLMTAKVPESKQGETPLLPGEGTWIPILALLFIFISLAIIIIAYRKHFRDPLKKEEELWSREFWIFVGTLVLTLAAIHITVVTSVNVGNIFLAPFENIFSSLYESTHWDFMRRLSQHSFAAPADDDRFHVYHKIQVPLAAILFAIIAIGQYLKYRNTDMKQFRKKIAFSFFAALAVMACLLLFTGFGEEHFAINALVFSALFAFFANAYYAIRIIKGQLDHIGASIAHLGFAMLIIGAVVSTSRNYFISKNTVGNVSDFSKDFSNNEDMMILKGDTLPMGDFFVYYKEKKKEGEHLYCTMEYFENLPIKYKEGDYVEKANMLFRCMKDHISSGDFLKDHSEDSLWSVVPFPKEADYERARNWQPGMPGEYLFTLRPSVLLALKGNSREPSIKHYLGKDLYTFIKYTELEPAKTDTSGYLDEQSGIINTGQSIRLSETVTMKIDSVAEVKDIPENFPKGVSVRRAFAFLTDGKKTEQIALVSVLMNGNHPIPFPTESKEFKMLLSLKEKPEGLELTVQRHASTQRDMLIMTAEVFPQINILWAGCIVMVIGTTLAIRHRVKQRRKELGMKKKMNPASDEAG